ncbi:E3 ubiquitin-protein ligase XIAP-like [Mya arenaria]|nr:E3 ubiquitin-protein ligase XIAP-like [Mya arenaria]XP_052811738.1 E3 ubiquitin-protein ligase XIAP-like [Mya arenaria]XP_052811739.1 E3 ubiquitin-protein ligase XIAP-like [Mya arenaria]
MASSRHQQPVERKSSSRFSQPFERELSLKKLINAGQLNIKRLAEAGFHFHFDSVTNAQYIKCYACNCCLKNIRPEEVENIWTLHAQFVHYPDCTHVLSMQGLDFIQDNQEGQWGELIGYNPETVRTKCWENKPQPSAFSKINARIYRALQSRAVDKLEMVQAIEDNQEFADEDKRLETMLNDQYALHAEAGFYRENFGDSGCPMRLRCFSCKALWVAPDREDPWEKHVFLQDACQYLLLRKGKLFVQQTYKRKCRRQRHLSK